MEIGHSLKRRRTKEDVHGKTQVYATESGRGPTEGRLSLMEPIGVVAACTAVLTSLEGEIVSDEVEFRDVSDPNKDYMYRWNFFLPREMITSVGQKVVN